MGLKFINFPLNSRVWVDDSNGILTLTDDSSPSSKDIFGSFEGYPDLMVPDCRLGILESEGEKPLADLCVPPFFKRQPQKNK